MTNLDPLQLANNNLARQSRVFGLISLAAWSLFAFLPGPGEIGPVIALCILIPCMVLIPFNLIVSLIALCRRGQKPAALTGLIASALCIPLFLYYFSGSPGSRVTQARTLATQTRLADITTALKAFHKDSGRYPTTAEGLSALITSQSTITNWHGPYLTATPSQNWTDDFWGQPLIYESPAKTPDSYSLFSSGRDCIPNTSDDILSP